MEFSVHTGNLWGASWISVAADDIVFIAFGAELAEDLEMLYIVGFPQYPFAPISYATSLLR